MTDHNIQEKMDKLANWATENKINKDKLHKVFEMLHLGKRDDRKESDPIQFPSFYIKDAHAKAWHNASDYKVANILKDNFKAIRKEAIAVFEKNLMDIHPENDDLAGYGTWNTFFFYKNGAEYVDNHRKCPQTSRMLKKISGVEIAGRTYFSAMTPGIHIKPHCGPHNFKLRTHLGIVAPKEAVIRVGNVIKPWIEGECIIFDDSFEHEVWNRSSITRIVLIVDVWNPCLIKEEIMALEFIMPEFYKRDKVTQNVTA